MTDKFTADDVQVISQKPGFRGFFGVDVVRLKHKRYDGSWSEEIERELFLRGDAVGVLIYDPINDLLALVEQFRAGAMERKGGPWIKEVVAGMKAKDECARAVAVKECFEEAAIELDAEELEPIVDFMVSPGGCDERFYLFFAQADLQNVGGIYGLAEEHEDLRLTSESYDDVMAQFKAGEIESSATVICLQWLQMNRERLRREALSR